MKKIMFCAYFMLNVGLFGCGSTDGALNTSMVTATVDKLIVDSDVASWVGTDGTTKATACLSTSSIVIPAADSVNVSIVSKAYSNTGSLASPIRVESVAIIYTPADSTTPAMATVYQDIGMTIANGSTATIPIEVTTQKQKSGLISVFACTSTNEYYYYAKIIFNITEISTGKKTTVDSTVNLHLYDYVDK